MTKKSISRHNGGWQMTIEPVHCGTSSILKVRFLGHPVVVEEIKGWGQLIQVVRSLLCGTGFGKYGWPSQQSIYSSNLKISNQLTSASSIVLFIRAQWELPLAIFSYMLIMKCTVSKTSRGTSSIKKSEQASICLEFALFSKKCAPTNVPAPNCLEMLQHLIAGVESHQVVWANYGI